MNIIILQKGLTLVADNVSMFIINKQWNLFSIPQLHYEQSRVVVSAQKNIVENIDY